MCKRSEAAAAATSAALECLFLGHISKDHTLNRIAGA